MKSVALALGGGGARGLSHIAVFEALDEMGVRPAAIAGTSIGALLGAAYASGMSGKDIRKHVTALAHDRGAVFRGLLAARAGRFASLSDQLPQRHPGRCREILRAIPARSRARGFRAIADPADRDRVRSLSPHGGAVIQRARCGRRSPPRWLCPA